MKVTGDRYYRLYMQGVEISRHLSKEECIERAVKEAQDRGAGKHELIMIPPQKRIEIEVVEV